jgi:uncharacterized peroxidase-related enzyme
VDVIPQDRAAGALAAAYSAVRDRDGMVENLYLAMSQIAAVIKPADDHYRALLHNPDSPLEPWLAEFVSTYTAILCGSKYAYLNHGENFHDNYRDRVESERMMKSLMDNTWRDDLQGEKLLAALSYAEKLTLDPTNVSEGDIQTLRDAGFDDKEISYIVQLVASFCYWSRVINGFGIKLGKTIGFNGQPAPTTE